MSISIDFTRELTEHAEVVESRPAPPAAALAPRRQGAVTFVVDNGAAAGGTVPRGAGCFWLRNSRFMPAHALPDLRQATLRLIVGPSRPALCGGPSDQLLSLPACEDAPLEIFYDRANASLDALEAGGLRVTPQIPLRPPVVGYPGCQPEDKAPVGRALLSLAPEGVIGDGAEPVRPSQRIANEHGILIVREHRIECCLVDGDGRVCSVRAHRLASQVRTGASRRIARGGFAHDLELRRNFPHGVVCRPARLTPTRATSSRSPHGWAVAWPT